MALETSSGRLKDYHDRSSSFFIPLVDCFSFGASLSYDRMMKQITVLSDNRDCLIELTHRDSDPGSWIVRRWKKHFLFRRRVSSDWFNGREQALAFVDAMMRERDVR